MSDDVQMLVGRCLSGDQVAMAAIVDRFQGQVFGLCFRMLGHRQDAEDVSQEAFSRAWRSIKSFDATREFRPWLLAIAGNRCRSWLAARARRPTPSEEVQDIPDRSPNMDGHRALAEEVALAMGQLRVEYRQAFLLFHTEDLSYQEIADALACPIGTAKTWVHRARRELAECLRDRGVVTELPDAVPGI